MRSVKSRVQSVSAKGRVWSAKCKAWSVKVQRMPMLPLGSCQCYCWRCLRRLRGLSPRPQLRSFFREYGRAGLNRMQVRCTSKPTYWGNVCWRGRGWEHICVYCCTRRMKNVSIANILKSIWGRCKGPPSASEWTFGSAGRSRMQWKKGSWGQNVSVRATWKSKV